MIFHNQQDRSRLKDSSKQMATGVNSKGKIHKAKSVRQRRMELRRVKSLYIQKSAGAADGILSGGDVSFGTRQKTNGSEPLKGETFDQLQTKDAVAEGEKTRMSKEWDGECGSYGSISVIGRRREMEDAVAAEVGFLTKGSKRYDFYGVYDGHGGSRVAQACRHWLHKLIAKTVGEEEESEEINWKEVMVASFEEMDEEVNKNGAAVATVGSTATVAVVGDEAVVVANCGDSRAVLSRGGVAVPLSVDHKPERPDELTRIEFLGGKVIDWNGQRVLGVLATSRSIGDYYLKPFVIPEPEVTVSYRTKMDEFMILASDGLWDVISNDLACQLARRFLYGQTKTRIRPINSGRADETCNGSRRAAEAAAALAELAMARGSRDNISVIVVDLMRSRQYRDDQIGKCCC